MMNEQNLEMNKINVSASSQTRKKKKHAKIVIVGSPNVGKSVLFNALTGAYVTVSNYPGTTVELSNGKGRLNSISLNIIDTPGMYRLLPITEEERVARNVLINESPDVVIHVVDAKNLNRMLPMTLQLKNAGLPVFLVINMMDEADRLSIKIDPAQIEHILQIPVVTTALARNRGIKELKKRLSDFLQSETRFSDNHRSVEIPYPPLIKKAIQTISSLLKSRYALSANMLAYLFLLGDKEVWKMIEGKEPDSVFQQIKETREKVKAAYHVGLDLEIAKSERALTDQILKKAVKSSAEKTTTPTGFLDRLFLSPYTGFPIIILVLYLFYLFVGVLGAQTIVDFLEISVFGQYINPLVNKLLVSWVPWQPIRDLFGGEYGIITLGIRYAIAIILPIVGTFFLAFSFIEDSGYLPRLALLVDRFFKKIGLNGRAVLPIVLGFGCDTMATVVTRTLETKRERIISTLLLTLAIPCSAQLGVLLAMASTNPKVLWVWIGIVLMIFFLIGFLSSKLMPGVRPSFYIELPPLRFPRPANILVKTYTRMEWYFKEVLPFFVLASVLLWLGQLTGLFEIIVNGMKPLMSWMGLPGDTAVAFIFGFFRRDYGAAGLYDLRGILTGNQLLIAITVMTLFVPCIAQFAVTIKERGIKTALGMFFFVMLFAFGTGIVLHKLFAFTGIVL